MTDRNHYSSNEDEIDLREIFVAVWQGKWFISAVTLVVAVFAVFYSLSLPNIYKSDALLAPVDGESSRGVSGQLGGLAALAGVNIGGGRADKTAVALEVLKSRDFIGRFIERHDLFATVMAAEKWEQVSNRLIFDSRIYIEDLNKWVRPVKAPFDSKPSLLESYEVFSKALTVSQDKTSGLISISFEHVSPYEAHRILELLLVDINNEMRKRDLNESKRSIDYLNAELARTNLSEARTMLFSLIEEQTKTLMLANIRSEYVFNIVDPAVVPEKKSKPARAMICIILVSISIIASIFIVLVRYFFRK
ncbi:MAG: Wzz/FepE/Etk N-terminal domain-containing protein [Alishewanella aestuarii]